jgi:hypothetical protein
MAVEVVMLGLMLASFLVASSGELQEKQLPDVPVIQVAAPGEYQLLRLKDGTSATGRVESIGEGGFTFRTLTNSVLDLELDDVLSLTPKKGQVVGGEFWPADSNPTRLFFAPTGRSLRKGEASFGVYEFLLPFVQYGVTDRLSIGGGTPMVFAAGSDMPLWFTPKFRIASSRTTDVSLGVLHVVNMGDANVGIAYAVATRGSTDAAVTGGLGYAYASDDADKAGSPVAMIGAEKRLSRRIKFVTENYWFDGAGLVSGGIRFLGDRLSADVALVSPIAAEEAIVFPMVNFVWKF